MRSRLRDTWGTFAEASIEFLTQQIERPPAATKFGRVLQASTIVTTGLVTGVIVLAPLVVRVYEDLRNR
jgi:hypothetical protein